MGLAIIEDEKSLKKMGLKKPILVVIKGNEFIKVASFNNVETLRTCVNCGRKVNNGGWYADGRTRCPIEEHYALPKDGFCHLWEKRNITDDDYPERRTDGA